VLSGSTHIYNEKIMYSCHQCGTSTTNPKFCDRSCAAKFNNKAKGPRTQATKDKISIAISKHHNVMHKIEYVGDYSPLYFNTCAKTGITFFSSSWRKYHPSIISDQAHYYDACRFRFAISEYPDLFDSSLINNYGWYSTDPKNQNLNGVSRDHKISISYGWKYNISPEILSHPLNCELVLHKANQKKRHNISISVEKLIQQIKSWQVK
jgi:hypothetical protein